MPRVLSSPPFPKSASQNQASGYTHGSEVYDQMLNDQVYSPPLGLGVFQENFDWISTTNPFQRISHLRDLEDNWDGYGAPRFSGIHIRRTLDFYCQIYKYFVSNKLDFLRLRPFVAPCSDGSVLFDLSGNSANPTKALEIYIPSELDKPLEYLKSQDEPESYEEEGQFYDDDNPQLLELLDWLFKKP